MYVGEGSGAKLFSSAEQMTRRDRQRADAFYTCLALTSLPFPVSCNENPPSFADENCTGKLFCSPVQVVLDAARFKFYFFQIIMIGPSRNFSYKQYRKFDTEIIKKMILYKLNIVH